MEKVKVYVLRGLMGSGKTTWCKKFLTENQNFKCSNRDSIRHCISNYTFNDENEKLVTVICQDMIRTIIKEGYNLILDETNLNDKTMTKNIEFIKSVCKENEKEADIEIKDFEISLQEAIRRDKERDFSVGEDVIRRAYKKYIQPKKQRENVQHILNSFKVKDELPLAIIFDLDGTMALNDHRSYYDYSEKVKKDKVNIVLKMLLSLVNNNTDIKLFAVSGREGVCKEWTEEWLTDCLIPYDNLYMREAGDNRPDDIVKKEIYDKYIKDKYHVVCVFDDRKRVLRMWKNEGLYVCDCSQDPLAENVF